jgi:hypothetical protein
MMNSVSIRTSALVVAKLHIFDWPSAFCLAVVQAVAAQASLNHFRASAASA